MRRSLWQKRIPTFLGLILLGVGLFAVSYIINNGQLIQTEASPAYTPKDIRITNLSDTSFTVSYTTEEKAIGSISYQTENDPSKIALDDRDQPTGEPKPYLTHHITINNLKPQQDYTFTITSKDKTFLDGDQPFTVTTLSSLATTPPTQQPIVGKVTVPGATTTDDTLIFLVSENAQVFSVFPKADGNFMMPLNALRTANLDEYLTLKSDSIVSLLLTNGSSSSQVKVLASQLNPVPPITLSQNYDFTTTTEPVETPTASESAEEVSFPSFSATEANSSTSKQPKILTPQNKETFEDQQPSFSGIALPGEDIEIVIHSEQEITATIQADEQGEWTYRPDEKLEPGEHTLTIRTRNSEGILQTLTRSFTVYAAGSQFIEPSVSPSAPTPTPTVAVPTPTPTIAPTATPTPIIIEVTVTPPPPTEPPGSSAMTIFAILASVTVGGGLFLLLTNRNRHSL